MGRPMPGGHYPRSGTTRNTALRSLEFGAGAGVCAPARRPGERPRRACTASSRAECTALRSPRTSRESLSARATQARQLGCWCGDVRTRLAATEQRQSRPASAGVRRQPHTGSGAARSDSCCGRVLDLALRRPVSPPRRARLAVCPTVRRRRPRASVSRRSPAPRRPPRASRPAPPAHPSSRNSCRSYVARLWTRSAACHKQRSRALEAVRRRGAWGRRPAGVVSGSPCVTPAACRSAIGLRESPRRPRASRLRRNSPSRAETGAVLPTSTGWAGRTPATRERRISEMQLCPNLLLAHDQWYAITRSSNDRSSVGWPRT